MNASFQLGSHEFYITLSFGISMFPEDGDDPDTLLKNADNAMFQAREAGRNSYHFFNASLNKRTVENLILENSLRKAIERDELLVYYQPQMNLTTGEIDCLEALVRWKHPDLGMLRPAQFLPIAEENGFISTIDLWVLHAACAQNKAWQQAGLKHIPVSVNLSARELHDPGLIGNISRVLGETGLESTYLEIEVTETSAMRDIERAISNMDRLREMGVGLAIDDFGSGFSSLNYLKKLPIGKIKIDKSFVKGVVTDAGDQAIVSAVIAMGKNLNLCVVAEGVEMQEQLDFLKTKRCDAVQGFLFSEPLPAKRFDSLLLRTAS
jgi:EAL domain-containing protein (putative c-di-GMP-specific phosphodiesterase class I)